MTELRKAAERALEALEWNYGTDLENIENCTAWLDKLNATIPALRQALAEEALDRMVAENERLGLYENTPAVKTYCGGKPNYCTTQEPEYVIDCPRCGHCCPERKWVGLADYTNQVTNGRMRIDAETGDVCIGTPSTPAQRTWVGLTDDDIAQTMLGSVEGSNMLPYQFARAIEAKLKEKNT